ncbi:gag_pre-integrs domain-containing protein [Trichonephila clavipes]|nr:gag_pre-integrs domain-containing protein [Trichonephila clavipes]
MASLTPLDYFRLLTPLDYFLSGYVKSLVYADKPQTLDHLEDNIRRVIADIRPQMLEKVIENWTSRLDYIRASRGSHMPEIIFKILELFFMNSVASTLNRVTDGKKRTSELSKLKQSCIRSQSSSVDETRFGESGECLSSFTSKKSKTLPGATTAAHGDPKGKNDYQNKSGKVFNCKTIKNVKQSIKTIGPCYVCNKYGHLKVNCKEKKSLQKSPSTVNETFNTEFNINLRFCEAECSLLELDKQLVTSCILFEENSDKGVWVIDTAATSHFCNDKSLFLDLKPITNMKMSLATEDKKHRRNRYTLDFG